MLSIIHSLLLSRHSTLIIQCSCYFTPLLFTAHNTTTFVPTYQQNRSNSARFCATSLRHFVYSIPLLSAHPSFYFASQLFPQLHFANVVVKLLLPSTFFSLCHSNHTNQIAVSITQNCRLFRSKFQYNYVHFHINLPFVFQLRLHFSSPSLLHHLLISAPQLLISTLII